MHEKCFVHVCAKPVSEQSLSSDCRRQTNCQLATRAPTRTAVSGAITQTLGGFRSPQAKSAKFEALADNHDSESKRQKRKSGNVTQAQIAGEKIAHIGTEDAREAERYPVSRAEHWQVSFAP